MVRLGRSNLEVFGLCLGGNVFGWTADEQQSFAVLDAYVEAGGNFIDTSDSYSALADLFEREGLSCVPYWALARGFLTGKYRPGATVDSPGPARRASTSMTAGSACSTRSIAW